MVFSRCGESRVLATASGDDTVRLFKEEDVSDPNQPSFSPVVTLKAHSEDVNAVSWNPKDTGLLASCSDDGTIKLWRLSL